VLVVEDQPAAAKALRLLLEVNDIASLRGRALGALRAFMAR
jgi:hypothetical protein